MPVRSGNRAFDRGDLKLAESLLRRANTPEVLHLVSPMRRIDTALNLSMVLLAEKKLSEAERLVEAQQEIAKDKGWTDRLICLRIKRRLLDIYRAQRSGKANIVSAEVVELSRKIFGLRSVQFVGSMIERCRDLEMNQDWIALVDSAKTGVSALRTAPKSKRNLLQRCLLNSMLVLGLFKLGQVEESKRVTRQYLLPEMNNAELRATNLSPVLTRIVPLVGSFSDAAISDKVAHLCYPRKEDYPELYNEAVLASVVASPTEDLSKREQLLKEILTRKLSASNKELAQQHLANFTFLLGDDKKALQMIPPTMRSARFELDRYISAAEACLGRKKVLRS